MAMGGTDEEWVRAAMTDDVMVVDLLVRLHRAPPAPPPKTAAAALPLEWSVRQRRSKSTTVDSNNARKTNRSHRASPTTPLSWSGATSFSGGSAGAGSEESSRLIPFKLASSTRSKDNVDGEKTNSKRSRKKKTLAELKDEESSLLKERRSLKREMAALKTNLERQRATNEKLKRMKIDVQPSPESTSAPEESISCQHQDKSTPHPHNNDTSQHSPKSNAQSNQNADTASGSKFILPDLNIACDEPSSDGIS